MLAQIEVKNRTYNARTAKTPAGFAAIVSRRQQDTETLLYRITFTTRSQAMQAAKKAAASFAANDAYTN